MATTESVGGAYGTAGSTSNRMGDFASSMQETAQSLRDRAKEFRAQYFDTAWASTRECIRSNPGKTVLISAAIGLVLGSMLSRRFR